MDLSPARRSMSRSRLGLLLLGLAAVFIAVYLVLGGRAPATSTERSPRPSASATQSASVPIGGALVPVREARLAVAVSGAVTELPAPVGTVVEVGQPLLRVDGTSQLQAVKVSEADVRRARAALAAANTKRGALPGSATSGDRRVAAAEVAVADAAYRFELAALAKAKAEAALIVLKAPFAGTVTAVETEIGEQIGPGDPVITLADTSSWLVEALAPEALAVGLTPGDAASVSFAAVPGLTLDGTVRDIALVPTERGTDTGYIVNVEISGTEPRLRSGLAANVTFVAPR